MLIGQAYTDILIPAEQQALSDACEVLIDHVFEDIMHVEKPEDVADTWMSIYLPERYLYRYTPRFLRKFAVCLITVAWKLAQPQHMPLSSLAEELAAWTIVQEAKRHLEDETDEKVEDAFDSFIDIYFEDLDLEYLYDDAFDGIDETALAQQLGISSLAFKDWFTPFSDEPARTPHPFVVEDDSSQKSGG
jgi:hypothetical protein